MKTNFQEEKKWLLLETYEYWQSCLIKDGSISSAVVDKRTFLTDR